MPPLVHSLKFKFTYSQKIVDRINKHLAPYTSVHDYASLVLYRSNGDPVDNINNLISKGWSNGIIPMEPGYHEDITLSEDPFLKIAEDLYQVEIFAGIKVVKQCYFGQIPIEKIKGFADEVQGGVLTKGFETSNINFHDVKRDWQEVENRDQLAIRPVLGFGVKLEIATTG